MLNKPPRPPVVILLRIPHAVGVEWPTRVTCLRCNNCLKEQLGCGGAPAAPATEGRSFRLAGGAPPSLPLAQPKCVA